ncbi:MAG: hypothetical protein U0517_04605 [Candidatus Andersenbacteria bacterium]
MAKWLFFVLVLCPYVLAADLPTQDRPAIVTISASTDQDQPVQSGRPVVFRIRVWPRTQSSVELSMRVAPELDELTINQWNRPNIKFFPTPSGELKVLLDPVTDQQSAQPLELTCTAVVRTEVPSGASFTQVATVSWDSLSSEAGQRITVGKRIGGS